MARRSFSLMLAWRYLNPRRAMLSAVTLISVTGVLLGVLVLVVVMAVYAGLERTVKDRLLGFTPHVKLEYPSPFDGRREQIADWRETADKIKQVPGVSSATAFVQEYVLMISEDTRKRPVFFRGVDTQDPGQVAGLEKLLDEDYPGSSADMGLDNRVVLSSTVAKQFGLRVGDKVKFLSAQNLTEMDRIDRIRKRPLLREEFAAELGAAREGTKAALVPHEGKLLLKNADYSKFINPLIEIYSLDDIRDQEREILGQFLALFEPEEETDDGVLLPLDVQAKVEEVLGELDKLNVKEMNADILDGFMEIVLPKEATVIGVYGASQMALTPDVFMPLPLAQELAGLQGAVQGIAVRLDDAYQAHVMGQKLAAVMPPGWVAITWMEEFGEFSNLINQQRVMMYFALSFIILVSAFSMMAVMFTVTIQKRREIGVMKALGAAPGQIVKVFVYQGMILGFVGSLLGVALALVVIRFRGSLQDLLRGFGFDPFPKSFHGFQVLPAYVNPEEVTIIAIAAFILCSLAAFVPAFFAARSDAAKSLRNL
jgi:lipoprotein-releasing system permease protein